MRVVTSDVGEEAWDEARDTWAFKYMASSDFMDAHVDPALVVYCTTDEEVVEAIRFAAQCGYSVTVRSGG